MNWRAFGVSFLGLVVVAVVCYYQVTQSTTEVPPPTVSITFTQCESDDQVLADADPRLTELYHKHATTRIAYELADCCTAGSYVVGMANDGGIIWFVSAVADQGIMINTLQAVGWVSEESWEAALDQARHKGYPYPSPGDLHPYSYVQSRGSQEPLRYRGLYFWTDPQNF